MRQTMQEGFNEVRLNQALMNYQIMLETDPTLVSPHKKNVMALCMDEVLRLRSSGSVIALNPRVITAWRGEIAELPPGYVPIHPHWYP